MKIRFYLDTEFSNFESKDVTSVKFEKSWEGDTKQSFGGKATAKECIEYPEEWAAFKDECALENKAFAPIAGLPEVVVTPLSDVPLEHFDSVNDSEVVVTEENTTPDFKEFE